MLALLLLAQTGSTVVPVEAWLKKPGVRFVAVQSFQENCDDCRRSANGWKRLRDRHAKDGLRVLTVSGRHPLQGCLDPGWKPDALICDAFVDGVRKAWRLRTRRPTTFLWDWTGRLLLERGDLAAVRRAIEKRKGGLANATIDGRAAPGLGDLLAAGVRSSRKYRVAPARTTAARLAQLGSHAAEYEGRDRCDGVPPGDVLLGAKLLAQSLVLTLRSESGCQIARRASTWNAREPKVSVQRAVEALFAAVPRIMELPKGKPSAAVSGTELIPDGMTPEADRARSRQRLEALSHPRARLLAPAVRRWIGTPHQKDGTGAQGINAQNFARAILMETFQIDIGNTLKAQLKVGPEIPLDRHDPDQTLQPGDLIFFVTYAYIPRHVTIYLGQGFVAHATAVRGVVVDPIPSDMPYYFYTVARRPQ